MNFISGGEEYKCIKTIGEYPRPGEGERGFDRTPARANALTRLPDHLSLLDRLANAISKAHQDSGLLALLFLGIDNFAQINESLGHTTGDKVLRAAAQRIDASVNRAAMVAHHGGGKFLILLEGMKQTSEAACVASELIEALAVPVKAGDRTLLITPCIGISVYPGDGRNAAALFDRAGAAMYRAKRRGTAGLSFSNPANECHEFATPGPREANQRTDKFLGMLAHELRNPLAPIATCAAILERVKTEPRVQEVARVIHRQVDHLRRLVDDLLDASRFTRGEIALTLAPFKLRETVETALEMLDDKIKEHDCSVELSPSAEELCLIGDQARIVQALTNLLDNACKFSPPGTEIRMLADASDGWLRLRVIDRGAGLDPAFLPQIFDLFTQYHAGLPRDKGGLGMGLAVAREIAELHGGHLRAHSDGLGKGAEFVLEIPVRPTVASGEPGGGFPGGYGL